jgi:hypothetical protein
MVGKRMVERAAVSVVALAFAVLALSVTSSPASGLEQQFSVNDGAAYARGFRVSAGDAGWSPFFAPGVVVWDGGSIISGHGADPGYEFPAQTLAMVPRVCRSYTSFSGGALIADMIAEAPTDVDARYRADADLDLCVVQAGGGDFRHGTPASSVYASLRSYCLSRRAAGFRVVVLSILPCDDPVTFEATRLAFDAMLRSGWTQFADGLADVAADHSIGDTGDDLDRQFYAADARHLNNAGNAVMAAVAAPVIAAQPWMSARCELRLRDAAGEWGPWRPYAAATTVRLLPYEGTHLVEAEYRLDGGQAVAAADDIFVDTVRPVPQALRDVVVRRGRRAALPFRVDDAEPCGPTCLAVLTVTTRSGRVLKTFVRRLVPVNARSSVAFTCRLPKGTYRYVVTARDTAGNPQAVAGTARLTVR